MFQPSFLNKQAAFGFANAIGKKVVRNLDEVSPAKSNNVLFLSPGDAAKKVTEKRREDGNGLVGDVALGATGMLTPKSLALKEKVLKQVDKGKDFVNKWDTIAAGKVTKKMKDGSMGAKLMSVPEQRVVGSQMLRDGSELDITQTFRRASLLAPAQNTAKVVAPILGSMYVAEKMYPPEEQLAFEQYDSYEKNGLESELLTERLDKEAAFQKVAQLQEELEKMAAEVEASKHEKNMFWKEAETERLEKTAALKEKDVLERTLLEKTATYDEFRLRVTSRERSKNVIKVAENLLEAGLIKQAEFNNKVDFLMDCDNETFNLYSSMTKHAQSVEKGLESSPFFIDYRSKEEESSPQRPTRGLSKQGQTIGEAARDLQK
jgi:hypothetical protein